MRIQHNISALNTWRQSQSNLLATEKSIEKLSSGQRINRAGDDAAGLAISEKMRAQIRGLAQAGRNIQDGISLIQTAEGGLNEIHALLQRGRELAVQGSNEVLTDSDKENLQDEVEQILSEIDRIAGDTEFNTINLLNVEGGDNAKSSVLEYLRTSWLKNSADRINTYFGLTPDNVDLQINLVDGTAGGVLAYVSTSSTGVDGLANVVGLTIEMADYDATTNTIGGLSADRVIAHEMVHAIMARTTNFAGTVNATETSGVPTWFKEGVAELIQGADERLNGSVAILGNEQAVVDVLGTGGTPYPAWGSTSHDYSSAYAAVRFMHDELKANGVATGILAIFNHLSGNQTDSLDQAITAASGGTWTDLADFKTDYRTNGAAYIAGMNLANADTGAIGGLDADGGAALTDTTVISDTSSSADPTAFNEIYPTIKGNYAQTDVRIQLAANAGGQLKFDLLTASSAALGINQADLTTDAEGAITLFNDAISEVSAFRATLGALQNRLEHSLEVTGIGHENLTSSESRIRDADMARETIQWTKHNILSQASNSMLAQANQNPQAILQLLAS